MTNAQLRTLAVVHPDDAERQHVCIPVADLTRLLEESDRLQAQEYVRRKVDEVNRRVGGKAGGRE